MRRTLVVIAMGVAIAGCVTTPRLPTAAVAATLAADPVPVVPPDAQARADVAARHDAAWRRATAGDVRGASREFNAILKAAPDFYPSMTGLAMLDLAGAQFKSALVRLSAVTRAHGRYLPAWIALADAELGVHDDGAAIVALEHVLSLDPARDDLRSRLELVRLRVIQRLLEASRAARAGGHLEEAQASLTEALRYGPQSPLILRDLAVNETARGALDDAETHARRAIQLEPGDADGWIALADVLEAKRRYADAEQAIGRAVAIDPRPAWRERATRLHERAEMESLPPGFASLPSATTFTRAEAAAYIGIKLPRLLARAAARPAVATDIRGHWASPWIVAVTRAGVMPVFANHTFQPGATVRRSDLAGIAAALVTIAKSGSADLQRWRAARPAFADLPSSHAAYRDAALAVASGTMTSIDGRFEASGRATGTELDGVVSRVDQLSR
jgi:tetratricopeptide (TPR) repeat protein